MKSQQASEQLSLFFTEADRPQREPAIQPTVEGNCLWPTESSAANIVVGDSLKHIASGSAACSEMVEAADSSERADCEWAAFLRTHGRVPMLDDAKKPWEYRGWLLYYRFMIEDHPGVGHRWEYWYRTMATKKILDEPIPQVSFADACDKQVMNYLELWVRLVDRYRNGGSAVDTLLDWFLWGFGYSDRDPQLPHELNESLYRQVNIGPMLLRPYDYLGEWIMMQKGRWNPNAFYPTPHSIVEFMVRLTMSEKEGDTRVQKVLDPAVGSGRMLMHASNYSLRLYGVDIDPTLVKVTLVNGALYIPWILRPFPEAFFTPESSPGVLHPSAAVCEATA
jgi:hypothetical protein